MGHLCCRTKERPPPRARVVFVPPAQPISVSGWRRARALMDYFCAKVEGGFGGRYVLDRQDDPVSGRHGCAFFFWDLKEKKKVVLKMNVIYDYTDMSDPDDSLFPKNGMDILLWSGVRHPSIVRIDGIYSTTNLPGYAPTSGLKGFFLEFCYGGDMWSLPRMLTEPEVQRLNGPIYYEDSEAVFMPFIKNVLEGIKCLHDRGFAHTDIKSENICISRGEDGNAKATIIDVDRLLDFHGNPQYEVERSGDLYIVSGIIRRLIPEPSPEVLELDRYLSSFECGEKERHALNAEQALRLYAKWEAAHGPGMRVKLLPSPSPPQHLIDAYARKADGDKFDGRSHTDTEETRDTNGDDCRGRHCSVPVQANGKTVLRSLGGWVSAGSLWINAQVAKEYGLPGPWVRIQNWHDV
ncbi:unnamed protein product [Vitrella brassicaformis CCMP3155]|uniref:Protein kinase domain-containing protein n=1 Tax=Vitrella brassicaformis (strain CCMP3155) TaxID=1169540 RepID=A0A0G4EN87_VITBC|nr:unnamed protein product [Vitrella brassicaformis CCMP3155]|eukprot:CEL98296.1 unnamed protein product [Vitrella brassicaformis CCMP3155]